jgi:hypothetical protein
VTLFRGYGDSDNKALGISTLKSMEGSLGSGLHLCDRNSFKEAGTVWFDSVAFANSVIAMQNCNRGSARMRRTYNSRGHVVGFLVRLEERK